MLGAARGEGEMVLAGEVPVLVGEAPVEISPEHGEAGVALADGVGNPVGGAGKRGLRDGGGGGFFDFGGVDEPRGYIKGRARGFGGQSAGESGLPGVGLTFAAPIRVGAATRSVRALLGLAG